MVTPPAFTRSVQPNKRGNQSNLNTKNKMKRITLVWVVCLIACMGATTVNAQTLLCPGFETDDFGEVWSNYFGDLVSVVSGDQYSGTKACKLITDAGQITEVYQTLEITAGKAYTLSVYNKLLTNGGNATAMLGYSFLDASGANMTEFVSVPLTSTQGAWVKGSLSTVVAPAGAVYMWFIIQSNGGAGTSILFDDASVTEAGAKQSQTITGLSDLSKTTSDADFSLTATASSNLAVSYTSSNTAVATISGSTVHIVGAGTSTITALQAGNDTYAAAQDVTATLTVNTGTVQAQNLLSNPGIELGLDGEGKIKDWLINTDDVTKATFTVETTDKHSGTASAKIAHIGGIYADLYQVVPVTAGQTYTYSFWHNVIAQTTAGSGRIVFFANFYDSNSTKITMDISSYEVTYTLNTWQQYSVDIVAPANAAYVDFRIRLLSKPTALIDDASITVKTIDGINDVRTQLPVRIQNGNIIVTTEAGSKIEVYNALGLKLQSQTANSTEITLTNLPKAQVLIVRSGNAVAKVIL